MKFKSHSQRKAVMAKLRSGDRVKQFVFGTPADEKGTILKTGKKLGVKVITVKTDSGRTMNINVEKRGLIEKIPNKAKK